MKKIIPIITVLSVSCLLTGCNQTENKVSNNSIKDNVNTFKTCLENYTNLRSEQLNQNKLNKYVLTLVEPIDENKEEIDPKFSVDEDNLDTLEYLDEKSEDAIPENLNNNESEDSENLDIEDNKDIEQAEDDDSEKLDNTTKNKQISTLYSLSNDIDNSCDDFCELKEYCEKKNIGLHEYVYSKYQLDNF